MAAIGTVLGMGVEILRIAGWLLAIAVGVLSYRNPGSRAQRLTALAAAAGAVVFVLAVILFAIGNRSAALHLGEVEFGTGGSGCSVTGRTSTFGVDEPIYMAAQFERTVEVGEVVRLTVTAEEGSTATTERTISMTADCLSGLLGASMPPGRYTFEYRAGQEFLARGALEVIGERGSPSPSAISAGSFADLPFSLELGAGWVFGQSDDVASLSAELEMTNPEFARKLEALPDAPTFTSEFVAYEVGSVDSYTPRISCNTLDRGDESIASTLIQGERQNVEALAQLPGIVGKPTSDRITLPVGETVRVRWRWTDVDGVDGTSVGYLFVNGPTAYTCVFSAATSTIATHEPEWEAILRTFKAIPSASPSASASEYIVDSHQVPEIEALLPKTVAGRRLVIWSVRGDAALRLWGLSAGEIATVRDQLAAMGVEPNEVFQVTAGRGDVDEDPPYFVMAFRIPEVARDLLGGYAIASAGFRRETDDWQMENRVIGGKIVGVGPPDLLAQSEHQRGRPYLYGSEDLDISFIVIADDEGWAEEAIRQLPE